MRFDRWLCSTIFLMVSLLLGCGVNEDLQQNSAPIYGGASVSGFPAVGALIYGSSVKVTKIAGVSMSNLLCSGVLISTRHVLTAAHCITDLSTISPYAKPTSLHFLGGADIYHAEFNIAVLRAEVYPGYYFAKLGYGTLFESYNDLALVTLTKDAPVEPMNLFKGSMDTSWVGTNLLLLGYGSDKNSLSDISKAKSYGEGTKRGIEITIAEVTPIEFSAYSDINGPCIGDSGGPAFL